MNNYLHDAEHRTESWKRRHTPDAVAQLGVWRWKGIQDNAARILELICGRRVIDFGGFDGPLGFGSIVVDQKAEHKTLDDVDGQVDVIFTSHTLEHLDDPAAWLKEAHAKLADGGHLIAHVPAWTCERWRPEQYNNPTQSNGHKHAFVLYPDMPRYGYFDDNRDVPVATYISKIVPGDIEFAEYVGDDSILVIARKL